MADFPQMAALLKSMEAGGMDAAPSTLVQGSALQTENLSNILHVTTFESKHLKLAKMLSSESAKSTLVQFDRQLSYGQFGGSATLERGIGTDQTSEFVRIVVPMCFYAHTRRVSMASTMVGTVDGKQSDERAAADAGMKMAGDVEFDCFRGCGDFSNAGVFDGQPSAIPQVIPNIRGIDVHVRQSDILRNAQDLMFNEYGSLESVVLPVGGALTQDVVEDASLRTNLNFGSADRLMVDPIALANYNKIVFGKERIILAGGSQEATGAELRKQYTSGGTIQVESSHFLRGKFTPRAARSDGPAAPASAAAVGSTGSTATPFSAGDVYLYAATAENEIGESAVCADASVTIAVDGDQVALTIQPPGSGTWRWFNVYRTAAGGATATKKFIGRVAANGVSATVFTDLGNRLPGASTGFLIEEGAQDFAELAPYSRLKLAQTDLSLPEVFFRFLTLRVETPRHEVLLDSVT